MRAVVEHRDPVRHGQRLGLVVRDIDDGHAEPLVDVLDLELHLLAQLLVERAQRLVHQHQLGLEDQRAGQARRAAAGRRRAGPGGGCRSRRAAPCRARARRARRSRPSPSAAPAAERRGSRPPSCAGTGRSSGTPCRCRACAAARCRSAGRRARCRRAVGASKPASIMSVVVLPEPEGPSSVRNSPRRMSRVEVFDDERFAVIGLLHADEIGRGRRLQAFLSRSPSIF